MSSSMAVGNAIPAEALSLPAEATGDVRLLRVLTLTSELSATADHWRGASIADRVRAMGQFAVVNVVAPMPWSPQSTALSRRYQPQWSNLLESQPGVTVHDPGSLAMPRLLAAFEPAALALASAPMLLKLHRQQRFDVIDAGSAWPDGVAAAALSAATGIPFSVSVHADDLHVPAHLVARRSMMRWALTRAGLVVTPSESLRSRLTAMGVAESRIAVIPGGVDTKRFRPLERETARACLGIPSSARLVLAVGRPPRSNEAEALAGALAQLARRDPDLRLVIVGETAPKHHDAADLRSAVARVGLQGRATFVSGRAPMELVWWYNAADLCCLPGTSAGHIRVMYEALACGIPCLTLDGASGAVAEDHCHISTTPDEDAIAHAIERGFTRWWDSDAIAREAQSRRWDVIAREWCARFGAIAALRARPS